MIGFLIMLLCPQANAQLLKSISHLAVANVEVVERRDQFSLEIAFEKSEKKNILLNLFDSNIQKNQLLTIDIDENLARAFIKISPVLPFTLSQTPQGLILLGQFNPETDYKLEISDQLRDKSGASLVENFSKVIHVGNFKPQFTFLNKSRFIPPNLQEKIAFETINLSEVTVTVRQIYTQNIHQLLSSGDNVSNHLSDIIRTDKIAIKNQNNKQTRGSLSLEQIKPIGQGIFYLQAQTDNKTILDSTIIVVTELGAVLKIGENRALRIWTFKSTNLNPLHGVQVTLHSESNFNMGQCTTSGSKASCEIKWTSKNRTPFAVTLKKGIDQSYLRLTDLQLPNDPSDSTKRDYFLKEQPFDAFIFSERNIYRAGETIHFATQVRDFRFESIKSLPLTWKIFDSAGIQYKEFTTITSTFGTALLDLPTHQLYTEGIYTIEVFADNVLLDSYQFRLENFMQERFSVNLKAEKNLFLDESKIKFDIQTHQVLGSKPLLAHFSADCSIEEAYRFIPNHPEYQTGTYIPNGQKRFTIDTVTGSIERKDHNYYQCDFSKLLSNLPKTVYKAYSSISVSEISSLSRIKQTANTLVSLKNANLGIKANQSSENNSAHVEGLVFDLSGNIQKVSHSILIELLQIQTNWISVQQNGEARLKAIETINPKSISKLVESKDGAFQVKITPPIEWNRWIVRATDNQTKMVAELPLDSLLSISENLKFENIPIKVNKTELQVGEKFKVLIIPPFRGELVIGIETFKVIEQKWLHIEKIEPLELEFEAPNATPNFYITALLIKGPIIKNNKLITNRAWATQSLKMIPKQHMLNIQITAPPKVESLKELLIKVENKELTDCEYSIAIMDEDLLNVTQYKTPNPLDHFFDARKLNAKTFESLDSILGNGFTVEPTKRVAAIVGSLNKKSKDLLHFWFPNIQSDKNGGTELRLSLPRFQGKLKIFVVGSSRFLMGSSEITTEVKDSLNIQPQFPDYFTVNDKFDFKVKLANSEKIDTAVSLSLGTVGPIQFEQTHFDELVKAKEENQISGKAEILNFPSLVKIAINAIQNDSTKKTKEKIELNAYPNGVKKFLQFDTPLDKSLDLITALPPFWKKNLLEIQLTLSNVPFIGVFSHLSTLWDYPYNNLEQTVSKILPLIANNDLLALAKNNEPKVSVASVRAEIQRGLDYIVSLQTLDGGFAFWPNEYKSHPWGTAFATLALSEAINNGFSVSTFTFNKALKYLQESVEAAAIEWRWYENEAPQLSLALYVLAKNKKNISTSLKIINNNLNQLTQVPSEAFGFENLFLLVMAAKLAKNTDLFNNIVAKKSLVIKLFEAPFYEKPFSTNNFWSSMRMDGLRLNLLLENWPEHPAISTLIERISTTLSQPKSFFSTQDLSWALFAMSKKLKLFKIDSQLSKVSKLEFNGKKYKPKFYVRGIPIWYFSGDNLISSTFKFSDIENAKWAFHTKVTGYTMGPPPSLSPINVERAYLLPDGSEADETELNIGDLIIVELRIFNPRSIHFRNVALIDRLPACLTIDSAQAYTASSNWMNKNILNVEYLDINENKLQIFGDLTETEKYYYYQARAIFGGKFKAPSAKVELMYNPELFDFSSEATVGVSPYSQH